LCQDENTAELGQGGPSTWEISAAAQHSWSSSEDETQPTTQANGSQIKSKPLPSLSHDSSSEEEETLVLTTAESGDHDNEGTGQAVPKETTKKARRPRSIEAKRRQRARQKKQKKLKFQQNKSS